ncbi:MAG: nickel pincer cofactor biosynthesis protein LarB [Firmicutes bacterium]|jgi:hypothetical protein|nr:nickel pincer cofactor biosynthesis protein LarB [Bacillota bacterium]
MNKQTVLDLANQLSKQEITPDEFFRHLQLIPFDDLDFAKVDHHRLLRQGLPEAVYAPGKTSEQCTLIVGSLLEKSSSPVLLTRATREQTDEVLRHHPGGKATPIQNSRQTLYLVSWRQNPKQDHKVIIITAGTSDQPAADECGAVLQAYGLEPAYLRDCGVAGIHRLFSHLDELFDADIVVVAAGMEGALPSVVGGLVAVPVIAVPTSTGYGSGFEGITALLAMTSSCAAGITVMGIDNGFGAAYATMRILQGIPYNKAD